ncbi:MAG: hypothetical protein WCV90_03075 [Candidatus Woesearchaeota archaeon]|jgi:hypothetical protein
MVQFFTEKEIAVDEEEIPQTSEEGLTGRLSIDDYVIGSDSTGFYEGLLTITTTPLERILNYSGLDLTGLLEDLSSNDTYGISGTIDPYMHEVYQSQEESVESAPENQKDVVAYFIERQLDYVNPTIATDVINQDREDGDDVERRAKRWQYELFQTHFGAEIALYREQCAALQSVFS